MRDDRVIGDHHRVDRVSLFIAELRADCFYL
jgi:hypothetical protein